MVIRPEVQALPLYQPPGRLLNEVQRSGVQRVVRLGSNEGPWSPFPDVIDAMQRELAGLNRYPENSYARVREAIAERYGVPASQVVVGNGSHELIRLLCLVIISPGDEVLVTAPPYPGHDVSARIMGAEVRSVPARDGACDVAAMRELVSAKTRAVFICSPHNPTGGIVRRQALERYLESVPEHVVTVLDEAYHEYVTDPDYPAGQDYLGCGKPLAVLRTFSKIYGLAGLRAGLVFVTPELADGLNRAREPFPVNAISAAAMVASLARPDLLAERAKVNATERERLERALDSIGVTYARSHANFILIDVGRPARDVTAALRKHGVLVRAGTDFDLPTSVRVTIGLPEENDLFLDALRDVLSVVPATVGDVS